MHTTPCAYGILFYSLVFSAKFYCFSSGSKTAKGTIAHVQNAPSSILHGQEMKPMQKYHSTSNDHLRLPSKGSQSTKNYARFLAWGPPIQRLHGVQWRCSKGTRQWLTTQSTSAPRLCCCLTLDVII